MLVCIGGVTGLACRSVAGGEGACGLFVKGNESGHTKNLFSIYWQEASKILKLGKMSIAIPSFAAIASVKLVRVRSPL
jgi:hypothetical protein